MAGAESGVPTGDGGVLETEVKVLDVDRPKLEDRLIALGARRVFDDEIEARFYDFADHAIERALGLLRLRREGGEVVLTHKRFISDGPAKSRAEFQVTVSDFETMQSILGALGLSTWMYLTKHRTTYLLPGGSFSFDRHTGEHSFIPEFLEIEAQSVSEVRRLAGMLDIRLEDCRSWGFLDLIEHYSGQHRSEDPTVQSGRSH